VRVCIHRGAREVGGNCVEIEASGKHLLIDVGRPLDAHPDDRVELPDVAHMADGALLGVVLSHPHQDHYGLVEQLDAAVPIYIGEAGAAMLEAATFFAPSGVLLHPAGFLVDLEPIELGPFIITPYLVDHSAFDSYALLIEADGRRLFYSGDFRAHGRKAGLADRLVRRPPGDVDALLLEGTHLRADGQTRAGGDESDVELEMAAIFAATRGLATVFTASQNIDRLVTIYRACKRANRTLVIDLYTATIAASTGRDTIPQPGFPRLRVYVPNRQRILVKESGEFERVDSIRPHRIFTEEIRADPSRFVMVLQGLTFAEIARADCLKNAVAIWSLWAGYLEQPSGVRVARLLAQHDVPITHLHASGHARVEDLQALAAAFAPALVVPIHSAAPERYGEFFDNVEQREDGEWWTV
jgi:ribonuclease J